MNQELQEVAMTEKQLKVLVVADKPEARRAVQGIFDRHYDLTTVDSAEAAVEKSGQDDFDVIVMEVLLPRISGADVISEIKATKGIVLAQKTEHLKKMREAVSRVLKDLDTQKPAAEAFLRDSQGKHEIILNQIDGQMRELTKKNVQQDQQIQSLNKELETALSAKEEILKELEEVRQKEESVRKEIRQTQMEKEDAQKETDHARQENEKAQRQVKEIRLKLVEVEKNTDAILKERNETLKLVETIQEQRVETLKELEKATLEKEALRSQIAALEKDLRESESHSENVRAEKDRIEKKLAEFQEHWDKYIR